MHRSDLVQARFRELRERMDGRRQEATAVHNFWRQCLPPARARRHGTRRKFQSVFSATTAQQSCKYHEERKEGRKEEDRNEIGFGEEILLKEEEIDE